MKIKKTERSLNSKVKSKFLRIQVKSWNKDWFSRRDRLKLSKPPLKPITLESKETVCLTTRTLFSRQNWLQFRTSLSEIELCFKSLEKIRDTWILWENSSTQENTMDISINFLHKNKRKISWKVKNFYWKLADRKSVV